MNRQCKNIVLASLDSSGHLIYYLQFAFVIVNLSSFVVYKLFTLKSFFLNSLNSLLRKHSDTYKRVT